MRLVRLETLGFRNLKNQSISFEDRVTTLVGDNGHGKTSIIEAVFMLCSARSFRTQSAKDLLSWNSPEKKCSVLGVFESSSGSREISFEYSKGKRNILVNGSSIKKASSFFGQFLAIVFTPDELQIVKGAPSTRRRFIDRVLSMLDSSYVEDLVSYQRAIKNRNALLSQDNITIDDIGPWNDLLIKHGITVAEKRYSFIEEIRESFCSHYSKIIRSSSHQEKVDISYFSSFLNSSEKKIFSASELEEILLKNFQNDVRYRASTKGIHRDEFPISIEFDGKKKEARAVASQGQSRTAALALKLAAAEYIKNTLGEPPIVLLDDVESELDSGRVEALYRLLEDLKAQVIITSTGVSSVLEKSGSKVGVKKLVSGEVIT